MKKRLFRKRINQAQYIAQKKEQLQKLKLRNRRIFVISQELRKLKQDIKAERKLPLAQKKQRVLDESGMMLGLFLIADVLTATGKNKKELESNQEKAIIESENRLTRMAQEPLNDLYKKRQNLRKKIHQLGR